MVGQFFEGRPYHQRQGAQHFIKARIRLTDESVSFEKEYLDDRGWRRLRCASPDRCCYALKGIAALAWRDGDQGRELCIRHHKRQRKDGDVLEYTKTISGGGGFRRHPAYLHPSLHDKGKNEVLLIDGGRRLRAYLEAGQMEAFVVVFCALGPPMEDMPPYLLWK